MCWRSHAYLLIGDSLVIIIINIKTRQHGNAPIMHNSSKIIKRKKQALKILCCKFCLAADAVNSIHIIHQAQAASVSFPSPHSKFSCHFCGHDLDACGIAVLTQNVVIQWVASSTFSLWGQLQSAVLGEKWVSASQWQQLLNINSKQQLKKAKVTGLWGPLFFQQRGTVVTTCIKKRTL